jgi:hypothetical protein
MLVVCAPLKVPDAVNVTWPTVANGPTGGLTIVPFDVYPYSPATLARARVGGRSCRHACQRKKTNDTDGRSYHISFHESLRCDSVETGDPISNQLTVGPLDAN